MRAGYLIKSFIARHPLIFSLLVTLALFGLTAVSRAALPTYVVASVTDLPPEALEQPSAWERAFSSIESSENLFQVLAILLAVALLAALGWWREAGFNRPSRWRNLHLLWFPLLVGTLSLLGGVEATEPALFVPAMLGLLITVFGEELFYRGIVWRALAPKTAAVQIFRSRDRLADVEDDRARSSVAVRRCRQRPWRLTVPTSRRGSWHGDAPERRDPSTVL